MQRKWLIKMVWIVALILLTSVSLFLIFTLTFANLTPLPSSNLPQSTNIETNILPQDSFVLSNENISFDIDAFLKAKAGPLKNISFLIDAQNYSAGKLIRNYSNGIGLSTKMVLAYFETRQALISNPTADVKNAAGNLNISGFEAQLDWLTSTLDQAFYSYNASKTNYYFFKDGSKVVVPAGTTAATFAIFSTLALTSNNYSDWIFYVQPSGYKKIYTDLFGTPPVATPASPKPNASHPGVKLPWTSGETWYYFNGPHGNSGTDTFWDAVDYFPPNDFQPSEICTNDWNPKQSPKRSNHALRAPVSGNITIAGDYPHYFTRISFDANPAYQLNLQHVAPTNKVTQGHVNQGDFIGYPSNCGKAVGVHLHIATYSNNVSQPRQTIDGTVISGWTIKNGAVPYSGTMEKPGQILVANETYRNCSSYNPCNSVVSDNDNTCNDFVVSKTNDDGSCGTLRYALNIAGSGSQKTVTIALASGATISLSNGLTIPSGVTLNGICTNNSPTITLNGGGAGGNGLTLSGDDNINGINVTGFSGYQIFSQPGSGGFNNLTCVSSTS